MPSLLAVSGLNVDRAFPGLGVEAAQRRRALAITGVVNCVRVAEAARADTIVIVGGLFDDRTASATALSSVVPLLNAFSGRVLIAPGRQDPYSPQSIHATTEWGERTSVWTSPDFADPAFAGATRVLGRAARAGGSGVLAFPFVPQGDGGVVLAGVDLPIDRCMEWASDGAHRHVVTTGPQEALNSGVTVLGEVNRDVGATSAHAALISLNDRGVTGVEFVEVLSEASGSTIELAVTELASTTALLLAIDRAVADAPAWAEVRLAGTLQSGVLLPAVAAHIIGRADVRVEVGDLTFAFDEPDLAERTATAEFIRSLSAEPADDRERHQAIALGLAAFAASSRELSAP